MVKRQKSIWAKLRERYVFSIRNESHFEESARATLSINEVISISALFLIIMLGLAYLMFKFSPMAYFVGGESPKNKKALIRISDQTDSLEARLSQNQFYYTQLQNVLSGKMSIDSLEQQVDSNLYQNIELAEPGESELELRKKVEEQEKFNLTDNQANTSLSFLVPLDGVVSSEFNPKESHFGIDIVAPKGSAIKAIASGVVIHSGWSSENGNTIMVSHKNNTFSLYKHNEKLLKKAGDLVQEGEAIALIGNSGKNTSGYHLHFELWKNNTAVNPEQYFNFK